MVDLFVRCSQTVRNMYHSPTPPPKNKSKLTGVGGKAGDFHGSRGGVL